MTRLYRLLIAACCALLAFSSSSSTAQWTQTSGPHGANVKSIMESNGKLFLGTTGGSVFSSSDNGATWTSASNGLPSMWIFSLAQNGSTLFAGTQWYGIYRSTDGGANWEAVNTGIPQKVIDEERVYSFVTNGAMLYACIGKAVFRSSDHGSHWQAAASGFAAMRAADFFDGGMSVVGSSVFAGNVRRGIFRSDDNGQNWIQLNKGLADTALVSNSLVTNGKDLFVATETGGIFRSTDNAANWSSVNKGLPSMFSSALSVKGSLLYAVCKDTLFQSADKGDSWTRAGTLPHDTYCLWSFGSTFFCEGNSRLYRSVDNGSTWTPADQSLSATSIYSFAGRNSTVLAGTTTDAVFRSSDRGATWLPLSTERVNGMVNCLAFCGPNLIAAGTTMDGGIDISTDLGASWKRVTPENDAQIEALAVQEPYVYAAGEGIWVSSDNGATWVQRRMGQGSTYFGSLVIVDSTVYASELWADSIYVSTDKGITWSGRSARPGMRIIIMNAHAGVFYAATDGQGVFRSTDGAKTWTPMNSGLADTIVTDIVFGSGMIFASTRDRGVFFMEDTATQWKAINNGLVSPHIQRLFVYDGYLYAGTFGHGVWLRALSEITGRDLPAEPAPFAYEVEQNYPNPFNPFTMIRYTIPEDSRVTLTVFTVLGQKVATIFNGFRKTGSYVDSWHSTGASGLYFYRLDASPVASPHHRYSVTKKMMLVR